MTATVWLVAGCCLLGLLVGSFLNVVVYRVPRAMSVVHPASRCPSCAATLRSRDNIPLLSWIALRGRCAHCGTSISARYPLVEAATAVSFGALALVIGPTWLLPVLLYTSAAGIALTLIDIDTHRLPDRIVVSSWIVVTVLTAVASAATGDWSILVRAVLAGLASMAALLALHVGWPGGMGGGDVKLAGLLGLVLGPFGWAVVLFGLLTGFALGAAVGVTLIATGRATRSTAIPFGPFLIAGAFVAVFVGVPVVSAYLDLLSRVAA